MKRIVIFLTALLALPAMAQEDALVDLPGYVDFGELGEIYGEPKVQIALGEALLGFVSAMAKNEEPETAELFNKLKGVRVNVYNVAGDAGPALDQVKRVGSMLSGSAWSPIVRVNEEGEQVQIFLKMNGETVEGLTLMAVDGEEAVFINVIGDINPADLGRVVENFDVDIDGVQIDTN